VNAVGQGHVDAYYEASFALGQALAPMLAEGCADVACAEPTLANLALHAFRRPPEPAEVAFLRDDVFASAATPEDGFRNAVTVLTSSPDFLYRLEQGEGEPDDRGARRLTPYELASRLSFHFWQAPPDQTLLDAAASGAILTEDGYRAQVDRLFEDPRTREAMHTFFEAWLELEAIPDMNRNTRRADFQAFAGDDLPDRDLRQGLINDVLGFIDYLTWEQGAALSDLFTSRAALPPTDAVARLYGLDAASEVPMDLNGTERAGLLTRPALLAYNQAVTRPIMRGTLVRVRLLCDDLSLPDNMDDIQIPEGSPAQTTRDKVVELTETPGSTCDACHQLINPFGFALEAYDALGRHRTEESFYSEDGERLASLPVDTSAQTMMDGELVAFDDAVQMSAALAESTQVQACFARHYFRYSFGRREDLSRDGCTLESIRARLAGGAPLAEVLRQIALEPSFRQLTEAEESP